LRPLGARAWSPVVTPLAGVEALGGARCLSRLSTICAETLFGSLGGPRVPRGGGHFSSRLRPTNLLIGSHGAPPAAPCAARKCSSLLPWIWRSDGRSRDAHCENLWRRCAKAGSNLPKRRRCVFPARDSAHVVVLRCYARTERRRAGAPEPLLVRSPPAYTVAVSSRCLALPRVGHTGWHVVNRRAGATKAARPKKSCRKASRASAFLEKRPRRVLCAPANRNRIKVVSQRHFCRLRAAAKRGARRRSKGAAARRVS